MPDNGGETDEKLTEKSQYRWKGLSTVVCFFVIVVYVGLVLGMLTGHLTGQLDHGTWGVLTTAFIVCVVYAVGTDTYKAVKEARQ